MKRIVAALAALALSLPILAAEWTTRRTEQLIAASPLFVPLNQVDRKIQAMLAESSSTAGAPGERLRPTDAERIAIALAASFKGERLREAAARELRRALAAEDEALALAWLEGPMGSRIARLESRSAHEGGAERYRSLAKSLLSTSAPHRRALFARIAAASNAAEANADMVINMVTAVVKGAELFMQPPDPGAAERMRKRLSWDRMQLVHAMREQAMMHAAYTYRELTDEELEAYIGFLESGPGLRYSNASAKAIDRAFTQASNDLGRLGGESFAKSGRPPI
jgi:hypothetical protein